MTGDGRTPIPRPMRRSARAGKHPACRTTTNTRSTGREPAALGSFHKTASIPPTASLDSFRRTASAPPRTLPRWVQFRLIARSVPRSRRSRRNPSTLSSANRRQSSIQSQFPKDVRHFWPPSRLGFVRAFFVSVHRFDPDPHLPFAPPDRPLPWIRSRVRCRLTSSVPWVRFANRSPPRPPPWVRFAKRPPSRPPPRWVRFAERHPLRLARCLVGFVSFDPSSVPRSPHFLRKPATLSSAQSSAFFDPISIPKRCYAFPATFPPRVRSCIFRVRRTIRPRSPSRRSLFLPGPLRWLRSRTSMSPGTLGSFRKTLPYSAARLAGFVSADPSFGLPSSTGSLRPTPSIQYDLQIPKNSCISALGFFVTTAPTRLGLSPVPPVAPPRRQVGPRPGEGRRRQFSDHGSEQHPAARSGVPPSCKSASHPTFRTSDLRLPTWPGPRNPQPPTYPLPAPCSPLLPLATHHSANSADRPV